MRDGHGTVDHNARGSRRPAIGLHSAPCACYSSRPARIPPGLRQLRLLCSTALPVAVRMVCAWLLRYKPRSDRRYPTIISDWKQDARCMLDSPMRRSESVDAGLQRCSPILIRNVPCCAPLARPCPWVQGVARTLAEAGGSPVCLHRFLLCLGALRWSLQMVWARRRLRPNTQRDRR